MNQVVKMINSNIGGTLQPKLTFEEFTRKNNLTFYKPEKIKRQIPWNIKRLAVTLGIMIFAMMLFIGYENVKWVQNNAEISPYKNAQDFIKQDHLDRVIAFGSLKTTPIGILSNLLDLNIINENQFNTMKRYEEGKNAEWYIVVPQVKYYIYFGVLNDQEVVIVGDAYSPYELFIMDNQLGYSFQELIDEFEALSGVILTEEFLNDTFQGDTTVYSGISISIELDSVSNKHVLVYRAIIEGIEYEVRK